MKKQVWALLHTDDRAADSLKLFWSQDERIAEYRRIIEARIGDGQPRPGWSERTLKAVENIRESLKGTTAEDTLAAWDEFICEENDLTHGNHERFDTYISEIEVPDPLPKRPDWFKNLDDFGWLLVLEVIKGTRKRMAAGDSVEVARSLATTDLDARIGGILTGLYLDPKAITVSDEKADSKC